AEMPGATEFEPRCEAAEAAETCRSEPFAPPSKGRRPRDGNAGDVAPTASASSPLRDYRHRASTCAWGHLHPDVGFSPRNDAPLASVCRDTLLFAGRLRHPLTKPDDNSISSAPTPRLECVNN